MNDFYRDTKTCLQQMFQELSALLDDVELSGALPTQGFQQAYTFLREFMQSRGGLEMTLDPSGSVALDGEVLPVQSAGNSLVRILARLGVRALIITPALTPEDLQLFLQTVAVADAEPVSADADLVTMWYQEGTDSIRFGTTDLATDHLFNGATIPAPEGEVLEQLASGTRAPERMLQRLGGLQPATRIRHTKLNHAAIAELLQPLRREDNGNLRLQLTATLMAAMSCRSPALSPHELSFLLGRVIDEQILGAEWERIQKTIRNLEFMLDPDTRVQAHTRAGARRILDRVKSSRTLVKLVLAASEYDAGEPPFKLLRWLFGDTPLPLWKETVTKVPLDHVPALVTQFTTCFALQHPFWLDAVQAVQGERLTILKESMARLETQFLDLGKAPVDEDESPDLDDSDFGWADFDFDALDEPQLDDEMIAFLDNASSDIGDKKKPDSAQVRAVRREMLDDLDALEMSIMRGEGE